jgi:hypothetical protein
MRLFSVQKTRRKHEGAFSNGRLPHKPGALILILHGSSQPDFPVLLHLPWLYLAKDFPRIWGACCSRVRCLRWYV